jgi:hypothetical protein
MVEHARSAKEGSEFDDNAMANYELKWEQMDTSSEEGCMLN